ncbi:MAG: Ca2+-binding RTX toxin-like protein [Alteromonas macleodii]
MEIKVSVLTITTNYHSYILPLPGTFSTIETAMDVAYPGDTIVLEPGYSSETVTITQNDITISGTSASLDIELLIADGVSGLILVGDAPINVTDSGASDILTGNEGDNTITVTGGTDFVDGGAGVDRLVVDYSSSTGTVSATTATFAGSSGTVEIVAGSIENFTVLTGNSIDTITLTTAHGNNYVNTGDGASTVVVGDGDNVFVGGGGIDTLTAGNGENTIDAGYGSIGANTITVGSGNNTILGGDGIDTISAGGGDNTIEAGDGANTIAIGPTFSGANVIIAGNGIDIITTGNGDNYIDAGVGTIGANTITVGPTGFGTNTILGGDGIDTITVGKGDNNIEAGNGANTITAGPTGVGNNRIIAGDGIDTITTGNGDNCIDAGSVGANTIAAGSGNNVIVAGSGIDTITVGNGDNYIAAGDGANTVTAGFGDNFVTIGDAIDTITAMGGNNVIEAGTVGVNTVTTGGGNDVVETGSAADVIVTGAGNDIIKDAGGAGSVTAGTGHDRFIADFSASTASVTNTAIDVDGTYAGLMGATTYAGVEEFHITGGSGDDIITTGAGADILDGGAGADTLIAGGGSDVIYGGVGGVISGGEDSDGNDHDVLVLNGLGAGILTYEVGSTENGTFTLNAGGSLSFTGIESVLFDPTTITTPEDTAFVGDLGVIVDTFGVGNIVYNAGDTAFRTEVELTINSDGTYSFIPAKNYNGPGPVTTYTTLDLDNPINTQISALIIEIVAVQETAPACLTGDKATTGGTGLNGTDGDEAVSTPEGVTKIGNVIDFGLSSLDGAITVTGFTVDTDNGGSDEAFVAGGTATIGGIGALTISIDGAYSFTPVADYNGAVPVASYTLTDSQGSEMSTLTIEVAAADDPIIHCTDVNNSVAYTSVSPLGNFMPTLVEGQVVDPSFVNGIINDEYLQGDGITDFLLKSRDTGYAWFQNVIGVYEITPDGSITDARILIENANTDKSAEILISNVESGNKLGFFLVQNAADWASGLTDTDNLVFVSSDGWSQASVNNGAGIQLQVNGQTAWKTIFHSYGADMNDDGVQHAVSGIDTSEQMVLAGFEDIVGGGDRDYEDVVFSIERVEVSELDCGTNLFLSLIPDLSEGQAVDMTHVNGFVSDEYLQGDGTADFLLKSLDTGYAWFQNVIGVYEITPDGSITDARILIENANTDKLAEILISNVESGNKLGFFLVQNAADWASGLTDTDNLVFVSSDGWSQASVNNGAGIQLQVNGQTAWKTIFHSYGANMNDDGVQHAILEINASEEMVLIGFEDIVGGGDSDYEDFVFSINKVYVDDFFLN